LSHIQYLYGNNPEIAESVDGQTIYKTSMRYHNLEAQFLVSPIDFFQGYYNPKRIWTPVLYASMGAGLNTNELFVTQSLIHYINYKKDNNYTKYDGTNFELALGAGLLNNFRINDYFDIFLDVNWTFHRWTLDSWTYEFGGNQFCFASEEIRPKRFDNMYTAALGLTYYFSRIYELCEQDTCNCVDVTPGDTIVKIVTLQTDEMVCYPFSIFFHRDSYELMSGRDLVNLAEIARVALAYNYKIRLRGSCDSATATPSYNQTLSENRCRKIMSELTKMGVPEGQIILVPKGGIKELDPTEYDRRVVIELVKD
jgi:outer membrane protein OmpA-like peptidoglycan-associated protein